MIFWGYNNEQEARKYWPNLDQGIKTTKVVNVCSRDKNCIGSLDGQTYKYDDGSSDTGVDITETTVIIDNNKIKF